MVDIIGLFQGLKQLGHGVDYPPLSCTEIKDTVAL
jgi:hypothetical protein